jgi:hypothetical protein
MTTDSHNAQVSRPARGPSEVELAELMRLRESYPRHLIIYEDTLGRGMRYTARSASIDVRPHTIITSDLAELRDELEQAAPQL